MYDWRRASFLFIEKLYQMVIDTHSIKLQMVERLDEGALPPEISASDYSGLYKVAWNLMLITN